MIHFDPVTPGTGVSGSITFDAAIMGLIVLGDSLNRTDPEPLGAPNTEYPTASSRGLEFAPNDSIRLEDDLRTLTLISLYATNGVDQIRVITSECPSPPDSDADGIGDACDFCPYDAGNDSDQDFLCANTDNCPEHANNDQQDGDDDGFGDACDDCPNTIPGIVVDEFGCPPALPSDLDRDGDGDLTDCGLFASCMFGPNVPHDQTPMCQRADVNGDNDVDLLDFVLFQCCFSGENIPLDPDCPD